MFKRTKKNINNGSGDNNINSNEGEKTKEMVLGLPPNRGQIKLKTFGDTVRTGTDPMEPVGDSGYIELDCIEQQLLLVEQELPQLLRQELRLLRQLLQELRQMRQSLQQPRQLLQQQPLLELRWQLSQQLLQQQLQKVQQLQLQYQKVLQTKIKANGDGSGGDGNDSGGSGNDSSDGDGNSDNDGGDKTEGGYGGKMGTKMEPKGQYDNRNRFSYHGGDENGYPVGQLHRCYYEKPNVCSIIPYQQQGCTNRQQQSCTNKQHHSCTAKKNQQTEPAQQH